MRILQSLYDAGGGTPPQLAIARGLVERGHAVMVLGHPPLRDRVEALGAAFTPMTETLPGHDMTSAQTDLVRDWEPDDPFEAGARFRDRVLFGPALTNAREVLALLQAWPADAVVHDWLLFGTALAAEVAKLPSVALVHSPYPLRDPSQEDNFFSAGLVAMNAARLELGLGPLAHWDEQLLRGEAVMMLTIPELDARSGGPLPANVHYVGAAFGLVEESWQPSTEGPLVVISFSTTYMDQRDLTRRTLEALDGLPLQGLLTTGPALVVDGLRIPDNVEVSAYLPHAAVLPHASLVITHAGFGTVQAALAEGVPLLCLPCGRDQPGNAAHIASLGAGTALPPTATVAEIRAAVIAALSGAELKARAQELASKLRAHDGVAATVVRVEALA